MTEQYGQIEAGSGEDGDDTSVEEGKNKHDKNDKNDNEHQKGTQDLLIELKNLIYMQRIVEDAEEVGEPEAQAALEMISSFNKDMVKLAQNI